MIFYLDTHDLFTHVNTPLSHNITGQQPLFTSKYFELCDSSHNLGMRFRLCHGAA